MFKALFTQHYAGIVLIGLLAIASMPSVVLPSSGQNTYNVVKNPSFEDGVDPVTGYPLNWGNWTKHSCVPYQNCVKTAEITVDNTRAADGAYSARVTLGQVPIGFASLWHRFPSNTRFSNLTDAIGNLDLWFYLEPKYAGMADFVIKVYAQNGQELDYVFDPDPRLSYPNQTFPLEPGRPYVKSFLLGDRTGTNPQYPAGEWHRFNFRNLKADWQVPMRLQNGTFLPGFNLNEPLSLLEIGAFAFQDVSTSAYYGIIIWTDDVKVLLDTDQPPPPPPPLHSLVFNFTDLNNNDIDDVVRWRIFNQTGQEITNYKLGNATLESGTYTLEVYYPAISTTPQAQFLILRRTVPLDTPTNIRLSMMKENTGPNDYIAFNNTITTGSITFQDSERISFTASGSPVTYKALVKVPSKPNVILRANPQTELVEGLDWTYNSTYSIVSMRLQTLGDFTAYFVPRPRLPTISFVDRTGQDASGIVEMRVFNSQNSLLTYIPGTIPPDENFPYVLQVSYLGHLIYISSIDFALTDPVILQMLRIDNSPGYIALNSTVTSITLTENSASRITFTVQGQGPSLIVIKVPARPVYVERNGARTASWTYDSTTGTALIETESLGSFSLVLSASQPSNYILYGGITAALLVAIASGLLVRQRKLRKAVVTIASPQQS